MGISLYLILRHGYMSRRVLILSVSRKVSLVRAFKEAGWYVIGQDIDPNAVALKFCDEVAKSDTEIGVDMILPTRDNDLTLGTHGASQETIDICCDKVKFASWCEDNGFKAPKTLYTQETKERGVVGRAFVKPRFSSSSNKAEGFVECVYQEKVEGEEYSIDCFSNFEKKVISIVPRKRLKVTNGESSCTQTIHSPLLVETASSLSQALGLDGHSVLQCFLSQGTPIWTDVNCRFGGASIVGIQAGCKSPEWYLKLINGEEVKPCIGDYKVGLTGRSYSDWTFDED